MIYGVSIPESFEELTIMEKLSQEELINLIKSVFPRLEQDRQLAILVDIPRDHQTDNPSWKLRREICLDWFLGLKENIN